MNIKFHWKRIIDDILLVLLSIIPPILAYLSDTNNISEGLFSRCGATMALFAAFLEFRTHEMQALKERDSINAVWRTLGAIVEALARTDSATKYILREMSSVIKSAGMEPAMGNPDEIKDMVVSERIKSLKYLPEVPESFYKYNGIISATGKILVVCGTLIWAFGNMLIK